MLPGNIRDQEMDILKESTPINFNNFTSSCKIKFTINQMVKSQMSCMHEKKQENQFYMVWSMHFFSRILVFYFITYVYARSIYVINSGPKICLICRLVQS